VRVEIVRRKGALGVGCEVVGEERGWGGLMVHFFALGKSLYWDLLCGVWGL